TAPRNQAVAVVLALALSILTSSIPVAVAGSAYPQQLAASGGLPPYSWTAASGALPTGLTLDGSTGMITGTTTNKGSFNFVVSIADQTHSAATKSFLLAVVGADTVPQVGGAKYKRGGQKLNWE